MYIIVIIIKMRIADNLHELTVGKQPVRHHPGASELPGPGTRSIDGLQPQVLVVLTSTGVGHDQAPFGRT